MSLDERLAAFVADLAWRDVPPDLATQISALQDDERISDDLEKLKADMDDGQQA